MRLRIAVAGGNSFVRVAGALATMIVVFGASAAWADIVHLKTGATVVGEIFEKTDQHLKVRTTVGTVTVRVAEIERVEESPTAFAEYDRRRAAVEQSAAAHFKLAKWCEETDLDAYRLRHLRRAVELEPDYAPAREALGYVRIDGMWVDGRTAAAPNAQPADKPDREPTAEEAAKLIAAVQAQWSIQIRSIRNNLLDSGVERLQEEGRRKILAINDPLAVAILANFLGDGKVFSRRVLVEVLSQFPQDEATMHLAALALTDDDDVVRRQTLLDLKARADRRVIPLFRQGLKTDSDTLIRRAAIALGFLEARSAVPDLIETLKAQRRKYVEVPVRRYIGLYASTFDQPTVVSLGPFRRIHHRPVLGLESLGAGIVAADREYQMRDVTVFRTEVLEALKTITGENHAFDIAAWRRWYEEQKS